MMNCPGGPSQVTPMGPAALPHFGALLNHRHFLHIAASVLKLACRQTQIPSFESFPLAL